jgi:hypothetical protein
LGNMSMSDIIKAAADTEGTTSLAAALDLASFTAGVVYKIARGEVVKGKEAVRHESAATPTPDPDGLLTPKMAAHHLGISVKTLTGHADDGEIRYIDSGRGKKKIRRKYTRDDLEEFKERRARRDTPCQSTGTRKARSTTMTSNTNVVGFTALRDARTSAKLKPLSLPSVTGGSKKPR